MIPSRHRHRAGALVAVVASAALLAACSSSTDGTAQAAGSSVSAGSPASSTGASGAPSSAAPSSAAPSDLKALALTQSDFPAGFEVQELSDAQLKAAASSGALSGATVTPSACQDVITTTNDIDYASSGYVVAVDKANGGVLTAIVSAKTVSPSSLREQLAGCGSIAITSAQIGKATGSLTAVDVPDVGADDSVGIASKISVNTQGQSGTIAGTSYVTDVRGVQVSVAGVSLGATPIDTATVDALLQAAVAKVRAG